MYALAPLFFLRFTTLGLLVVGFVDGVSGGHGRMGLRETDDDATTGQAPSDGSSPTGRVAGRGPDEQEHRMNSNTDTARHNPADINHGVEQVEHV
jgi:hypothetical protein